MKPEESLRPNYIIKECVLQLKGTRELLSTGRGADKNEASRNRFLVERLIGLWDMGRWPNIALVPNITKILP